MSTQKEPAKKLEPFRELFIFFMQQVCLSTLVYKQLPGIANRIHYMCSGVGW